MVKIVKVRKLPTAGNDNRPGYVSKAGDPRRSGRANPAGRREMIAFVELPGRVEARLGVVCVAEIRINPASTGRHAYFWSCALPMFSGAPRPANDLDAAKAAIRHRVNEWCEAAALVARRNSHEVER